MKPMLYGILHHREDDDNDIAIDPKTGGLDRPGREEDDNDVAVDPKTGGLDRPGR